MKNLANLAKGGGKKPVPAPIRKSVAKPQPKVVEKTKEEERDEKAKKVVEELLNDVELTPKKDEVVEEETVEVKTVGGEGTVWLEEQVSLLTEQNETLRSEVMLAKEDYDKLFQRLQGGETGGMELETLKQNLLFFFSEMQNAYLGNNPQGERYTVAYPERLLPKLVQLFPYLDEYRRF